MERRQKYIYLEGSYKDQRAKFILAIPVDIRRGMGHSLHAAGESQLRCEENTSRRWVTQHWSRSWEVLEAQPGEPGLN